MRVLWVMLAAAAAGCGYGFGGAGPVVPEGARTVYIERFTNRSRGYGLEVRLRRALVDEFRRRGAIKPVEDRGTADLVVTGVIRRVTSAALATGPTDEPLAYQTSITVAVRMTERASGRVLTDDPALSEAVDSAAVSNVVITTSPRFQEGTTDLRDLVDLTDTQLGESRRDDSMTDLIDRVARDIYTRTVEGF
jgi:hypothetical protein